MAVAGRSNAGKSSVINKLVMRKALARTSRTPGRTRMFNYFELAPGKRLVDLPGYGHASVSEATRESWGPLGDALRQRESFKALLLIVDCRRGIGPMDLAMIDWAGQPEPQVHVLLNKSDKLSRGAAATVLRSARTTLTGKATCQLFSVLKGDGTDEAQDLLQRWAGTGKRKSPGA
jgi:GTP-binding protein